jgi:hypothetical protein
VEEAKRADLAGLVAKADFVGVGSDDTGCWGTGGLYRNFGFKKEGLLFGDRLGEYTDNYYASVQFPAVLERRFELESGDQWIVFLTFRTDQGFHRNSVRRSSPAYDPAGDHAVLRATDELVAEVKKLVATKKANPERDAAIRKSTQSDSVKEADAINEIRLAHYAARRFADWSVEPLSVEPDADYNRERFRGATFRHLQSAGYYDGQESLVRDAFERDPVFKPLKDDPRWRILLQLFEKKRLTEPTSRVPRPAKPALGFLRRFEEFDRIAVGVFQLDLATERADLHLVAEAQSRLAKSSDERRKVDDLEHDSVPAAGLLRLAAGHRTRARSPRTA